MNQTAFSSLTSLSKGRSRVYQFLSQLFLKEVTPEMLDVFLKEETKEALHSLDIDISKIVPDIPQDRLLDELAEEYAALFIVPGGIPPYESVRLEGQLYQKSAFEVEEFYTKCGLVLRDDHSIFPDHLGLELFFMGYLADKEADSLINRTGDDSEKWLELQKEFFEVHLGKWVFKFLQDMEKCAFHPFYRGIAELTQRFLETEKEFFMEIDNN